jgi:hypothetical protein
MMALTRKTIGFVLDPLGLVTSQTLRVGWSDGVKSSAGYDYRPLMFEASIETNLLGDPW